MQALIGGNGSLDPSRRRLQEAVARAAAGLTGLVDELHELGVEVKDLDRGLVDFPARHPERGDTVLLCWQPRREVALARRRAGFAGRKPPLLENSVSMDTEWIERLAVAGVVLLATLVVARIADRMITRRFELTRDALRLQVVRRSVLAVIVGVACSARCWSSAGARRGGSILASSAVIALVFGLAAQSTLANFVAGILVAFAQPLRLGDNVAVAGASGTVQQIGLRTR